MGATEKNIYAESSTAPDQVDELFAHIRSFRRFTKGYRAIHLHFSILGRLHKQPHHRRLIATAFNGLIGPYEGKLFWTTAFDLFFVCRECPTTKLEKAKIDAIRAVEEDPTLKSLVEDGKDDKLCDWYDLEKYYDSFYELVENYYDRMNADENQSEEQPTLKSMMASLDKTNDKVVEAPKPKKEKDTKPKTIPQYEHIFPKSVVPEMGPMQLDKLERNLLTMDMFNMIKQQNMCVVMNNIAPEIIYTKKYFSLKEINKSVLPDYNIEGDKWLFQRLTKTFDIKMMKTLVEYQSFPDHFLSINMNVASILTKEFDQFIAKQKQMSEMPIILEISLFDIMSDLAEYYIAQAKLKSLDCKICICRMDIQSLYVLDRELINVDFLKIRWNKTYISKLSDEEKNKISNAIATQGKMRVVMSDCDSQNAITFGNNLGIVMFQGFEIDKMQGL